MAILSALRLLVDTDVFCKLGVSGLLPEAADLFAADLARCGRLPALPHMLRRGRLRKVYGPEACDSLAVIANTMPVAPAASDEWLDKLVPIRDIDAGEAQLFAASAEAGLFVLSGDKRALRALKGIKGFPEALAGRIVLLEAILLALSDRHGSELVRQRVAASRESDKMVETCFSEENDNPGAGLLSYYLSAVTDLAPLTLWNPRPVSPP